MKKKLSTKSKTSTNNNPDPGALEGARRATGKAPGSGDGRSVSIVEPNPEVAASKPRRKFSSKFKLRILNEVDNCTQAGQIGALLRREGLYSSHLTLWRKQKKQGQLEGLSPKKRGRKIQPKNPLADQMTRLEKENQKLREKLKKAETIIEVQKKISEILGISQNPGDETN